MKRIISVVLCFVIILTVGVMLIGCSGDGQTDEGVTYYSVSVDGGTGAGKYMSGFICTVKATVPEGKKFLKWIKNGKDASAKTEYSFNVNENSRLIAVFDDIVTNPTGEVFNVKITNGIGGGGYLAGSICKVKTLSANEGRTFKGWVDANDEEQKILSEDKNYEFEVTGNIKLTALYKDYLLPMPDNSDNRMFNLHAGVATIEYDRQIDPITGEVYTAFSEGVAYIKVHVYISDADDAIPIVAFKIVKRDDNSGYIGNLAGTDIQEMSGEPGNYYTPDGNTHNMLKRIIATGTNGAYSASIAYYFATQAIGIDVAEGEMEYRDSAISGKGRGVVNM